MTQPQTKRLEGLKIYFLTANQLSLRNLRPNDVVVSAELPMTD